MEAAFSYDQLIDSKQQLITNIEQLIGLMQPHTYDAKNIITSKECYKIELAACYVAKCLERS